MKKRVFSSALALLLAVSVIDVIVGAYAFFGQRLYYSRASISIHESGKSLNDAASHLAINSDKFNESVRQALESASQAFRTETSLVKVRNTDLYEIGIRDADAKRAADRANFLAVALQKKFGGTIWEKAEPSDTQTAPNNLISIFTATSFVVLFCLLFWIYTRSRFSGDFSANKPRLGGKSGQILQSSPESASMISQNEGTEANDGGEVKVTIGLLDENTNAWLKMVYMLLVGHVKANGSNPTFYEDLGPQTLGRDYDKDALLGALRAIAKIDIQAGRPPLSLIVVSDSGNCMPDRSIVDFVESLGVRCSGLEVYTQMQIIARFWKNRDPIFD